MKIHEKYIKRCIQLAKNGLGTTYPNPLVGSVVVYNDVIIGEGWHSVSGGPHAEVLAIGRVKDPKMFQKATIYVNLEPCNHYGKTPPCSDLIIRSGIKHVVIGTPDPFDKVAGKGIKKLQAAGVSVTVGVLHEACEALNRRFFTFHKKKRPYIILKWAESANGFLGVKSMPKNSTMAKPLWISNRYSRQWVHKWRSEEQAILVGTHTVIHDNPKLNVRDWTGRPPVRVVLDRQLRIPESYAVQDGSVKTIFITHHPTPASNIAGIHYENIDFSKAVASQLCALLYQHQLQSVIVEGGAATLQTFIDEGLWDEARVFKGHIALKNGTKAPKMNVLPVAEKRIAGDLLSIYKNIDDLTKPIHD